MQKKYYSCKPTLPVIMLGDFNIVLEDRDSINRNSNMNEVNSKRILKDLMYDINLKNCFRRTSSYWWLHMAKK